MVKFYKLIFSKSFSDELEEIIQYKILNHHADSKRFYRKFLDRVERLKRFPKSAPLAPEYYPRLRLKGYRMIHLDRYNIFFKVEKDKVIFHTIRHSAQKPE